MCREITAHERLIRQIGVDLPIADKNWVHIDPNSENFKN